MLVWPPGRHEKRDGLRLGPQHDLELVGAAFRMGALAPERELERVLAAVKLAACTSCESRKQQ